MISKHALSQRCRSCGNLLSEEHDTGGGEGKPVECSCVIVYPRGVEVTLGEDFIVCGVRGVELTLTKGLVRGEAEGDEI